MKKLFIITLSLLFSVFAFAQTDCLRGFVAGEFEEETTTPIKSMLNGESYTQLSADGKQIIRYSYKTGKQEQIIFDASKTKGAKVEKIEGYTFSPTEKTMLVYTQAEKINRHSFLADYYLFDVERNRMEAISDSGKVRDPQFSPDGFNLVFSRKNNLYLRKLLFNTESPVSKNGGDSLFCGITDWLYEEEFGTSSLIAWSPDSKKIVYVALNEKEVGSYSFDVYGNYPFATESDLYTQAIQTKYPKVGTRNPVPSVFVFDVYYKKTTTISFADETDDIYIPRIKWTGNEQEFAVFILNRNQDRLNLYHVNAKSLIPKLILSESSETYIDYRNIDYVQYINDGKFTFASERDGFRHLYLYNANGLLNKQLTNGNYDITAFYGYDSIKKMFYYQAAEKSPLEREIYSVDLKDKKTILATGGYNCASFSNSFTYFVNKKSSLNTAPTYSLMAGTKEVRTLESNETLSKMMATQAQKEFFTFKNETDTELNAWILKPANFDASKKYPVVMYQYGGPDSQVVLDKYHGGFEYCMAKEGFVVVAVDGRGTGARGEQFRKSTYQQLGKQEAQDLIAAAKYLASQPFVDKNKIGVWGWSYGGFSTLMAMSSGSEVFAAGVAVAPITDFKFYDTAYMERYMRRPQENLRGYDQSPMALASKLHGKLLLIHGTADDNCHLQNTLQYAEQLVQANKHFDMLLYTNKAHDLQGGNTRLHLYTRILNFFVENLK